MTSDVIFYPKSSLLSTNITSLVTLSLVTQTITILLTFPVRIPNATLARNACFQRTELVAQPDTEGTYRLITSIALRKTAACAFAAIRAHFVKRCFHKSTHAQTLAEKRL